VIDLTSWLGEHLGLTPQQQRGVWTSLAIVVALWALRRLLLFVVSRRTADVRLQYQWKKTSAYVAVLTGALLVGRVWFEGVGSLATYLGLLSAGLAIALKDLVSNLAGWAFILWRRPFEVGDRVEIGGAAGDVIDLRIFQFSLLEIGNWVHADQSTGRIIHVPNGRVFNEPLANYTHGFQFIWNELPVLVTFESDWQKAKELLTAAAWKHSQELSQAAEAQVRKAARSFMIFFTKLTPIVYTSVEDSGVLLTVRYLCDPRHRRGSAEAIWEDVLREFAAADDIDFAYPTQRFYDNLREGKPGARPPSGEGGSAAGDRGPGRPRNS
jgi:small-conductance mechanosensitive channel